MITWFLINTFEIGWFIYGNTLFYHRDDGMFAEEVEDDKLVAIMLFIIIWGYLKMLVWCCGLCCMGSVLAVLYFGGMVDKEAIKEYQNI